MSRITPFFQSVGLWTRIALLGVLLWPCHSALAQNNAASYPQKPIKILVGFSPGGVPDIVARVLAPKFTDSWKQAVVVENKLGAGSNVAAQAAATSVPDGYTLLSISSAHAISPAIYNKLPYDASKDFSGITLTATGPALVIVSPELNVNSMKEFIALAKSKPGQLNYSSAGIGSGSQFAAELLKSQAGIDLTHIPFKGIPEALTDTMAGRTHLFISPYASAINLVREGKAKAIAVTSTSRVADLPNLPTVAESGVPGYKWIFWYGLVAPANTPRDIVQKLQTEVVAALKQPQVTQRFSTLGIEAVTNTPEAFDQMIKDEVQLFKKLASAAGIKAD
ncbi:MAG: tripartite tricarboxylate transporter substrate binding protein [Betaproteobacteria bacterium]|nr:tripartite tricarboxylate transporter substrate binding protein [Betaproteobacteria bacterium]